MAEGSGEARMPSVEERLSVLETKSDEYSRTMQRLEQLCLRLDGRVTQLDQKMDRRFDNVDSRFNNVDMRFNWIVGFQIALLVAVIGALLR